MQSRATGDEPPVSRPPLIRGDAWDFAAAVCLHQVALTNHRQQVCHKVAIPSESFSGKNLSGKKRAQSVGPADLRETEMAPDICETFAVLQWMI